MDIVTVREDETLIAELNGRIDGTNAVEVQRGLESTLSPGDRALILDMEGVSFMSSAGLRVVAIMINRTRANGTQLVLCSLPGPVKEVLATSGFDRMVSVLDTLDEARATTGA